MAYRNQKYDVALNGQGLILANKPEQPRILAKQDDVFGQRFAQGDRDYNDLAKWWYMAQTDWLGGFKDVATWIANEGKYYYSINIDAISEGGAIKLALDSVLQATFAELITCGGEFTIGSTPATKIYIGTTENPVSGKPIVYRFDDPTWTDISSTAFPVGLSNISQLNQRSGYLWAHNVQTGVSGYVVCYFDGTSWVDESSHAASVLTITPNISACGLAHSNGKYYVFGVNTNSNAWSIVSCTIANPTAGAHWTKVKEVETTTQFPIAAVEYLGDIYYLLGDSTNNLVELRVYTTSAASPADSQVAIFRNATVSNYGQTNLLQVFNNKLLIIIPPKEQWSYDGTDLTRIYRRDDNKADIASETYAYFTNGGVVSDNKFYSGNYIFDGNYFHNWTRDSADTEQTFIHDVFVPLFVDNDNNIWGIDTNLATKLYKVAYGGSTYKGTANKNFIVFNNFDKVSGIDKLAYAIDIICKTLATEQKIIVEYTTGELTSSTTWTVLGSLDFSVDGAITHKTLYFGDAVLYKKVWFRVKLEGPGTTTPVMYDFVHSFLPMPDYRLRWDFTVKCQDEIQRKNQSKETKSGLWLRNYLQQSWLTKSILTFEDFDTNTEEKLSGTLSSSATTITVSGDTDNFPEFGRVLIDSEEIFYTGKTKTTLTGCTRGARGTNAVSHTANTAVTTGHRVIIRNYQEELILANDPGKAEYLVSLSLSEV